MPHLPRTSKTFDEWSSPILIDDLEIDLVKKKVSRDGDRVHLTDREYAILECLAMHEGSTVSENDIVDHLEQFHSSTMIDLIDVYIGYLKKKLNDGSRANLIHQGRKSGYILRSID